MYTSPHKSRYFGYDFIEFQCICNKRLFSLKISDKILVPLGVKLFTIQFRTFWCTLHLTEAVVLAMISLNFSIQSNDGYFLSRFLRKFLILSDKGCSSFNLEHFDVHFTSQESLFWLWFHLISVYSQMTVIFSQDFWESS